MPSPKYTKIEITPEAFLALESETILQGKTLKRLASEIILNGVSKESLDFAQKALDANKSSSKPGDILAKVIRDIGTSDIKFDESLLETVRRMIKEKKYLETMLYVAQHTASMQRDELQRVLTICEYHNLSPQLKADVIKNLNKIESGIFKI